MHTLLITLPKPCLNVTGQLLNDLGCDLISLVSIIKRAAAPGFLKPQSTSDQAFLRISDKSSSVTKIGFIGYCPVLSGNLVPLLAGNWVLNVQCWVCAKVWDAVNAIAQMRAAHEPKVYGRGIQRAEESVKMVPILPLKITAQGVSKTEGCLLDWRVWIYGVCFLTWAWTSFTLKLYGNYLFVKLLLTLHSKGCQCNDSGIVVR